MKWFQGACIAHVLVCVACTGDDVTLGPDTGVPPVDATLEHATPNDDGGAGASARLLMTNLGTSGELVAYNLHGKQVDGRFATPGYDVVEKAGSDFFLLETGQDLVVKLDSTSQWKPTASWNVALTDAIDGGASFADPVQIVESAPNKAYVIRFNRNRIAIIDPTQGADAGAASGSVDLGALQQTNDTDGFIDMSGAVYDATRKRLYVALGNIDINKVDPKGYFLLCSQTKTTLIAIDTTNDTLVSLGGTGPGGGVVLNGYGPQMGFLGGLVLDPVGDRVLVFSGGCNAPSTDAGAGALSGRLIEAVDLKSNTTKTLLDANAKDYPGQLVYIDGAHAVVQFGFGPYATTYAWIPTQPTLGAAYPVAPDVFAFDYAGSRILGPQTTFASDGGPGPMNVIAVPLEGDAAITAFGQNPFLQTGYLGNVIYVP